MPSSGYPEIEQQRRLEYLRSLVPDGVDVTPVTITGAPDYLDASDAFETAVNAAAGHLATLSRDAFDVLILGGALDPDLERLRSSTPVPIVGPGEASMSVASVFGAPVSIVTVHDPAVAVGRRFYSRLSSPPPLASIRSMGLPLRTIVADPDTARAAVEAETRMAVSADGAGCVILGAMTLGMLGVDGILGRYGVPIINPVRSAVMRALEVVSALHPAEEKIWEPIEVARGAGGHE